MDSRARCPACGGVFHRRLDGTIRRHRWIAGQPKPCPGSGKVPEDAR